MGNTSLKKPVLFPKIVFLYDENLHGPGGPMEDVFEAGIDCSAKTMYPDWLSLTGDGYVAGIYKKYGKIISPMGCRAFLSPWYERGGMEPADENDQPVFVGRFNIGAISLHLPMIYAKAKQESKDFYQVLDYYLNLIRQLRNIFIRPALTLVDEAHEPLSGLHQTIIYGRHGLTGLTLLLYNTLPTLRTYDYLGEMKSIHQSSGLL